MRASAQCQLIGTTRCIDGPAGGAFGVALGEVGTAEFLVGDVVGEHVADRDDDRVLDGDQRPERILATITARSAHNR
jgi:hypothetical protein